MGRTRKRHRVARQAAATTALVRRDGGEAILPVEELVIGDVVLVKPGDRLPVDGVVIGGGQ